MPAVPNPFFGIPNDRFAAGGFTGFAQAFDTTRSAELRGQQQVDLAFRAVEQKQAAESAAAAEMERFMEAWPAMSVGTAESELARRGEFEGIVSVYNDIVGDPEMLSVLGFQTQVSAADEEGFTQGINIRGGGTPGTRGYRGSGFRAGGGGAPIRGGGRIGASGSTSKATKSSSKETINTTTPFINREAYLRLSPEKRAKIDEFQKARVSYSQSLITHKQNLEKLEEADKLYVDGKLDEKSWRELREKHAKNPMAPLDGWVNSYVDVIKRTQEAADQLKEQAFKFSKIKPGTAKYVTIQSEISAFEEQVKNQINQLLNGNEEVKRGLQDAYYRKYQEHVDPNSVEMEKFVLEMMALPMVMDEEGNVKVRWLLEEKPAMLPQTSTSSRTLRYRSGKLDFQKISTNRDGGGFREEQVFSYALPTAKKGTFNIDKEAFVQDGGVWTQGRDLPIGQANVQGIFSEQKYFQIPNSTDFQLYNVILAPNFNDSRFIEQARQDLISRLSAENPAVVEKYQNMSTTELSNILQFEGYDETSGQARFSINIEGLASSGSSSGKVSLPNEAGGGFGRMELDVYAADFMRKFYNPARTNPYSKLPPVMTANQARRVANNEDIFGEFVDR